MASLNVLQSTVRTKRTVYALALPPLNMAAGLPLWVAHSPVGHIKHGVPDSRARLAELYFQLGMWWPAARQ
eukprot:scaffold124799_cov33-Tisochrysis_lutea.AAC.2